MSVHSNRKTENNAPAFSPVAMMTPQEFEAYWQTHRLAILHAENEYQDAVRRYRLSSGADWLLFAVPAVCGIATLECCPLSSELHKWGVAAAVVVVTFVLCVWVKSMLTPGRSPAEIEQAIKQRLKKEKCTG